MTVMTTTRGARRALVPLALAATLALTACGHNRTGDLEDKLLLDPFNDKPFTEDAVTFPAPPVDRDAVPFSVGRDESPLRFAIDPKSVSIGKDNVVRYTVLITSKTGARNVNYEGLRCDTGERRIYATLRNDSNQWIGNRAVDMNESANAETASERLQGRGRLAAGRQRRSGGLCVGIDADVLLRRALGGGRRPRLHARAAAGHGLVRAHVRAVRRSAARDGPGGPSRKRFRAAPGCRGAPARRR